MPRQTRIPSYRLHKPSGQAVVTINGKDSYLGEHESPESHASYKRLIGEWLANHKLDSGPTTTLTTRWSFGPEQLRAANCCSSMAVLR